MDFYDSNKNMDRGDHNFSDHNANKNNNSNPKNIEFLCNLVDDSFAYYYFYNSFNVFQSVNGNFYLIYTNTKNSIILFNLLVNKKINEIKNSHNEYISNFRHLLDKKNKRDLVISISAKDNCIKLWNINTLECLLHIHHLNKKGYLFSACFLSDNNNNYIITTNFSFYPEPIKLFDLDGNKIKEINESGKSTYFIDIYYDNKKSKIYVIVGTEDSIKSFDYYENKIYKKYMNEINSFSNNIIINDNGQGFVKLIESDRENKIKIWNFHSGELLKIIGDINNNINNLCLWNNEYIIASCYKGIIKLIEINNGKIIKDFIFHKQFIITIIKIIHPLYGECLISHGNDNLIKLWINKI